jgi:hypothetical protein
MEKITLDTFKIIMIGVVLVVAIGIGTFIYWDYERDKEMTAKAIKSNRHNINVISRMNTLILEMEDGALKDSLKVTGNWYYVLYSRREHDSLRLLDTLTNDSIYGKYFVDNNYRIIADTIQYQNMLFPCDTIRDTIVQRDTIEVNPYPGVQKINDSTYTIICTVC